MKNPKVNFCSKCGKPYKIGFARGMCRTCYTKYYRSTPEGKLQVKKYNDTKGRDAIAKYRTSEKYKEYVKKYNAQKYTKKNKEIKICECGEIAKVKGYCLKCYAKYYQREKFGYKVKRERHINPQKTIISNEVFNRILGCVKAGDNIKKALRRLDIYEKSFYSNATEQQRLELKMCKAIRPKIIKEEVYIEEIY